MSVKQRVTTIISSFRSDIEICQKIAGLLVEKRVFLSTVDTKNLEQVNGQLNTLSEKLGENAKKREVAMREFGLSLDRDGFMKLAAKLPTAISAEMTDLFERLEVHMNRCHSLNERNGELLVDQQATINNLLGREAKTYGETG